MKTVCTYAQKGVAEETGEVMAEHPQRLLLPESFKDVVVVANGPADYDFLPCPKIPDIHVGKGAMAGIHAGLAWAAPEDYPLLG